MATATYAEVSWQRMSNAVEKVRQRLTRAAQALEQAKIPYAVADGNAVAAWVRAWTKQRCVTHRTWTSSCDAPIFPPPEQLWSRLVLFIVTLRAWICFSTARMRRRAMRFILFSPLKRFGHTETFRLLSLDALVRMKLTSFRDKDRVHLRDLIEVGLVNADWLKRVPAPLRGRLQELLDNPKG